MTPDEATRQIRNAVAQSTLYANYLANVLNRMDANQQEYFLNEVAPYYLEGPGANSILPYKDMEYMARAVEQGKDVRDILGVDYRQIHTYLSQLPDIGKYTPSNNIQQQSQGQTVQSRSQEDIIESINSLIDTYMRDELGCIEQGPFCQSAGSFEAVPPQGWKFHISATTLEDYEKLLQVALPELKEKGVLFKVVVPEMFENFQNGAQKGKDITIYPTPSFDVNSFSPQFRAILSESVDMQPIGDHNISGRINARYGKFRGDSVSMYTLVDQSGRLVADPRHRQIAPDFVTERSASEILNFYSDSAQRYYASGDYKTYVQETALMTRGNGVDSPFIALNLNTPNSYYIENVVEYDPTGQSFVYQFNGESYAMIHNDYIDQALSNLDRSQILYTRPEWDMRYNVYQIPQEYINNSVAMVNVDNASIQSKNAPTMQWVQLGNDDWGIKVETSMNRHFQEQCSSYGLHVDPLITNKDNHELSKYLDTHQQNFEFDVRQH